MAKNMKSREHRGGKHARISMKNGISGADLAAQSGAYSLWRQHLNIKRSKCQAPRAASNLRRAAQRRGNGGVRGVKYQNGGSKQRRTAALKKRAWRQHKTAIGGGAIKRRITRGVALAHGVAAAWHRRPAAHAPSYLLRVAARLLVASGSIMAAHKRTANNPPRTRRRLSK